MAVKKNISINTAQKEKQHKYIYLGIILLLTIITFSDSINNGFVSFDDTGYITNNNLLKDISFKGLKDIFSTYVMGNYHPLTVLSDAIVYSLWGLNPVPYHALNLILHLINIILAFNLVYIITRRNIAAAIVSLILAIHPLHCENVCWVSDKKDLLYTLFYLAALISYIKYMRSEVSSLKSEKQTTITKSQATNKTQIPNSKPVNQNSAKSGSDDLKYYLLTLFLFCLSLLSKSSAVTFPVVLFIIDIYFGRKFSIRSIGEKIPLLALSVLFGIINIYSQQAAGAIVEEYRFYITDRIFFPFYGLFYYLYSFFLPMHLANLHPFPVRDGNNWLPAIYYITPFIILTITSVLLWIYIKFKNFRKDLFFGISFFIITIFLVLQFTPYGFAIVAERYTYLPYIGLSFIIARLYLVVTEKKPKLKININIFLIAVAIIFSITCYQRNKVWKNSIDLLVDLTEKYPDFAMAFDDLGVARMLSSDLEGAVKEFDKALEIDPNYYYSYNNRGEAKRYLGREEEAWNDYNRAILLYPKYSDAYNNRAIIKFNRKDYAGSIVDATLSIYLKPNNPNAYNNRASAKISTKDFNGAIKDYNKALELNPYYADGYKNRGVAKFYAGDKPGACTDWKKSADLGNQDATQLILQYCNN